MRFSIIFTVVALSLALVAPLVRHEPAWPVEPPPSQTPPAAAPPGPAAPAPSTPGPATPAPSPETERALPFDVSAAGASAVTTKEGQVWTFRGPVRVAYGDYVVTADAATYREESRIIEFTGHVTLQSPGETATGDEMSLNLRTREWRVRQGRTEVTPEGLQQGILSSLYLRSAQIAGAPGVVELGESAATTCDLPDPHYEIRARLIRVYPGDRLVAKGATLYLLGRRVLPLADLVIPLRDLY